MASGEAEGAITWNRARSRVPGLGLGLAPAAEVLEFHRRLPGYRETPLIDAPGLAERAGVPRLWIKDEGSRLGLPAFKMLGASWGIYRSLEARRGARFAPWSTLEELRPQLGGLRSVVFATATDGNHGRAIARMAALLGLRSHVYVPAAIGAGRIDAIRREGAEVITVEGTYDDALQRCVDGLGDEFIVASDTAWGGRAGMARLVLEGYGTLVHEVLDQLRRAGASPPDVVFVQVGVGSLAASVIVHLAAAGVACDVIGVEPVDAACVAASLAAGHEVLVPGPHRSAMLGLNCGAPSTTAWPVLRAGLTACVPITDRWAHDAVDALAAAGIESRPTGAAGLGALLWLRERSEVERVVGRRPASVLIINTEGRSDEAGSARA